MCLTGQPIGAGLHLDQQGGACCSPVRSASGQLDVTLGCAPFSPCPGSQCNALLTHPLLFLPGPMSPQVILCFSPVGHTLRARARKFPAIVNCTAIDWFHAWPQEALVSVSRRFIEEIEGIEVGHVSL